MKMMKKRKVFLLPSIKNKQTVWRWTCKNIKGYSNKDKNNIKIYQEDTAN